MTMPTGQFAWYELMTSDPQGAAAFYQGLLGWTGAPFAGGDGAPYLVMRASAGEVGGIMPLPPEAPAMPPCWVGYIGSAGVDADVARLTAAGGTLVRAAEDVPGVGRFAVMHDPGGATFLLLESRGDDPDAVPPPMAIGHVGWHELYSGDFDADLHFYTGAFGWSKGDAMDMGAMGTYQLVSQTGATDFAGMSGGIMPRPAEMPVPAWLFYFVVADIDAAVERVTAGGGRVLNGPMEVPGGAWIIQAIDPQAAMFALVGGRGESA